MKKLLLITLLSSLFIISCKPEDTEPTNDPEKELPEMTNNFFKVNDTSFTPDAYNWVQAGIFGYDQAFVKYTIDASKFEDHVVSIHVSSQFDYRDENCTYTLTTVTEDENVPEDKVYIQYKDGSGGFSDSETYVAKAGQTIEMTNTGNVNTGITAYFKFTDIILENDSLLSMEAPVN